MAGVNLGLHPTSRVTVSPVPNDQLLCIHDALGKGTAWWSWVQLVIKSWWITCIHNQEVPGLNPGGVETGEQSPLMQVSCPPRTEWVLGVNFHLGVVSCLTGVWEYKGSNHTQRTVKCINEHFEGAHWLPVVSVTCDKTILNYTDICDSKFCCAVHIALYKKTAFILQSNHWFWMTPFTNKLVYKQNFKLKIAPTAIWSLGWWPRTACRMTSLLSVTVQPWLKRTYAPSGFLMFEIFLVFYIFIFLLHKSPWDLKKKLAKV